MMMNLLQNKSQNISGFVCLTCYRAIWINCITFLFDPTMVKQLTTFVTIKKSPYHHAPDGPNESSAKGIQAITDGNR